MGFFFPSIACRELRASGNPSKKLNSAGVEHWATRTEHSAQAFGFSRAAVDISKQSALVSECLFQSTLT